jgi:hypothetical protein
MSRARPLVLTVACACAAAACGKGGEPPQPDAGVSADDGGADAGVDGQANAGFGLGQVDRAGRPLVAILLVPDSLRDNYNAVSTFDASLPRTLEDALTSRLQALDTIALGDGGPDPVDWPFDGGTHPLAPLFATDVLLVDTALSCTSQDGGFAPSYLDIETEIFPDIFMSDAGHTTCGGRTPSDDVVGATLTLLVTGRRAPVTQGVTGPTKPATTQFPYLAEPNTP